MNINEIARRAGVSRATVSRYLNDGYVSKEKRELIGRIIEETGYVPSQRAQQLRTGKTNLVGVIIPKINSQSVSRMVAGLTDWLAGAGYQVILANTNNDTTCELDYLKLFNEQNRVDGIVFIATEFTPDHIKALESLKVPIVILGQHLEGYTCVYQDDYHAMLELCRLTLRTANKAAYIGVFEQDEAAGTNRKRGFDDACAEAGIAVSDEAHAVADFDADSGYFAAEQILDTIPDVDTIVCATDDIAFGAMMCMREYGKRVPEDVQITGMGDSMLSRICYPSLTTAHLYFKSAGVGAAHLLVALMQGKSDIPREFKMGYEVYGRNSIRYR